MLAYERLLLAVNPASTNAHLAPAVEDNLRTGGLGLPVTVEYTVKGGLQANQEHFASRVRPGDLIVTHTGDGGDRLINSVFFVLDNDVARDIATTPVGGGEASDRFHALHGGGRAISPTSLIQRGIERACRPLVTSRKRMDVKLPDEPAFSYTGFGKSAKGSARVASKEYRAQGRLRREAALLGQMILGKDEFMLRWRSPVPAKGSGIEYLGELSVFIGSKMAKYGSVPVEHWNEDMFLMTVRPGALRSAAGLIRLASGHPNGQLVSDKVSFYTMSRVDAHFDGEVVPIAPGTQVDIGRHPRAIRTLVSPEQCLPSHLIPPYPEGEYDLLL